MASTSKTEICRTIGDNLRKLKITGYDPNTCKVITAGKMSPIITKFILP